MTAEPTMDENQYALENRLGATFRALGLSQATNLSFTSSVFETKFLASPRGDAHELGLDLASPSIKIKNPLNVDLDIMRISIVPSLARNAVHNLRFGRSQGGLFEIAPVFAAKPMDDVRSEKRPFFEESHLGAILWGEAGESWLKPAPVPLFYKLKTLLDGFLTSWQFKSVKFESMKECPAFLHPGQSARVIVEGKPVGFIGVIHPMSADQLELKAQAACMELNLKTLFAGQPRLSRTKALPKFPTVERDVALVVSMLLLAAGEIKTELMKSADLLAVHCEVFDLYKGDKLPADKKSLAFRLTYQDPQKTLSDDEINALHQGAVGKVCQKLGLVIR